MAGQRGMKGARRPVHPLAVALIALFAAAVVFAGYTIVSGVLRHRREVHAQAMTVCEESRSQFSQTYTSYVSTVTSASALANTDPQYAANADYIDELKTTVAPLSDGGNGTNMDDLAAQSCADDLTNDELTQRAASFGRAETQMINTMFAVQYQADVVKQSIDNKRKADSRGQIEALLPNAKLALQRGQGTVDGGALAALQSAADAADQAMGDPANTDNARYLDLLVALQSAYDTVIAAMPDDCHFHACVALTFDDGPNKQLTPQLLDALATAGAPATFFVQGQYVSVSNVRIVQRMAAEGHAVGSLSWRHKQLHDMPNDQLGKWFDDTDAVISEATGQQVTLFRPPDGAWSETVKTQAQAHGQTMILWNVDSRDWEQGANAAGITSAVVDGAARGAIVALHDGNEETIAAIPGIVQGLRDKGLTPVTVPQLLDGDLKPGAVYYYLGEAS